MNSSEQWRNYFEQATDNNKNYKIFIETAYGCHGSCQGCPLSLESRNSKTPKWEILPLENTLKSFAKHLNNHRATQQLNGIDNLAITVGPAENLYFTENYLENLCIVSKNFANDVNAKEFHLAVSTSGLFSDDKSESKLKALAKHLNRNQLSFAYIINLRQFEKTPIHYFNFAKLLFQYTDLVELEINMDIDIHLINKETLVKFSEFVNQYPFVQLDFAYAINQGNITKTHLKNKEFFDFVSELRNLTQNQERNFFSQWHSKLQAIPSHEFDFMNNFDNCFNNIVSTHIRLNAMGEWHFAKNILGTVYYDQTFGFQPLASFNNDPFAPSTLKKFKNDLFKFFNKSLSQHNACEACQWKNSCLNSGFLSYAQFSPNNETVCTNPSYTIFNNI